jgi:tRNA A-37 threonylcarbamoyl transferase component Bud32
VNRLALDFHGFERDNAGMAPAPFRCDAVEDPDIALEIERDAASCGEAATIARYAQAIPALATLPISLDTAIECALRAIGGDPLVAAQRLIELHGDFADAILACALGLGIDRSAGGARADSMLAGSLLTQGALISGRWRVIEVVGRGATAEVARVRDEALSTPEAPVEAMVKRFDESLASEARAHALREMRALLAVPAGLAPRPLALHASESGSCILLTRFEPSRAASSTDDFARALDAVDELHRAGLAHGDLKPDHLRVRDDGSVFLIDFGCACAANGETVRADLARLASMSHDAARTWSERAGARIARAAATRRAARLVCAGIRLASPRLRRRAALRGLGATTVTCGILATGLSFGRWLSAPPRIATTSFGIVDALSKTGRLHEARMGPDGRITCLVLRMPELKTAPGVVFHNGQSRFSHLGFTPDGGVVAVSHPEWVKSLSRNDAQDQ